MEWIERLNSAINYMEEHLTENIDYDEVARIAYCSKYHFQRMFAYIANISLSEYIRRRKMSLAAVDLQSGKEKVIDVAIKYGYDSPTSFNRAFQSVHGITPSQAKEDGVLLKAFPPITFRITIKGDVTMNYKIVKKDEIRIVGVSEPLLPEIEQNFVIVPEMWGKAAMNGTISRLASMMNKEPMGLLGVSSCNETDSWRYYIAVASSLPSDGFEEYVIPACTWAVFAGEGTSQSIGELEKQIVTDWIPTSGYEYANAPDIEVYLNADPQNAKYEVWIPITKKEA